MTDSTRLLDRLSRRGSWRARSKKRTTHTSKLSCIGLTATVSQATRERLLSDALSSPAFEGMEPAEVSAFVNGKIESLIVVYPWWFGRLHSDAPRKPVSVAQRIALEKARQRKAEIQREADAPYLPGDAAA